MTDKPILTTFKDPSRHWVGDGFLTQTMLSARDHAAHMSPFLLAGYNPAMWFDATDRPKGIGMHPHRGFATVTIVFQGGVDHADTMGNRGSVGPGEVQWMTAARGVQHEEFHSALINSAGGMLDMVQLWVNLPAAQKMNDPHYQAIAAADIPHVPLADGGKLRVIAGAYDGAKGPVVTATPLDLWDGYLPAGAAHHFTLPEGQGVAVLLLSGGLRVGSGPTPVEMTGPETVIFDDAEGEIHLQATEDAHYLVLSGVPIEEPIAMGGPFVMNTEAEIRQAFADFRRGDF